MFRSDEPGTAAQPAKAAIPTLPRTAITRRARIPFVPAILHPFPDVPAHVVQPQLIGLLLPDRMGLVPAVIEIPGDGIQLRTPSILVPLTLPSAPRGILPLRLRRQPIPFSRQGIQFLEKRFDVFPTDALNGTLCAALEATRVLAHDGIPQRLGHLIPADLKVADPNLMDRFFVRIALTLISRTPHPEYSAPDGYHLFLEVGEQLRPQRVDVGLSALRPLRVPPLGFL